MKQSTINLSSALPSALKKLFFCSQLVIISLSLPSLYYVGISHNTAGTTEKKVILTNKGKKFLAADKDETNEKTIKYSAA